MIETCARIYVGDLDFIAKYKGTRLHDTCLCVCTLVHVVKSYYSKTTGKRKRGDCIKLVQTKSGALAYGNPILDLIFRGHFGKERSNLVIRSQS